MVAANTIAHIERTVLTLEGIALVVCQQTLWHNVAIELLTSEAGVSRTLNLLQGTCMVPDTDFVVHGVLPRIGSRIVEHQVAETTDTAVLVAGNVALFCSVLIQSNLVVLHNDGYMAP